MTKKLFRKEVTQTKRRLTGRVILLQPLSTRLLTALISIIMLLIILFLFFGHYAAHQEVKGALKPTHGIAQIYPSRTGYVKKLLVKDHQMVKAGQALLVIRTPEDLHGKSVDSIIAQQLNQTVQSVKQRIQEAQEVERASFKDGQARLQDLKKTQAQLQQERARRQEVVDDLNNLKQRYEKLAKKGYVSTVDFIHMQNQWLAAENALSDVKQQLSSNQQHIIQLRNSQLTLPEKLAEQVNLLKQGLNSLDQQLEQAKAKSEYTIIAPEAGRVASLLVHQGQRVTNSKMLLSILPHPGELVAEIYLPANLIGFVHPGQKIQIEYEAFPYQWFGFYPAVITQISGTLVAPGQTAEPIKLKQPVYLVHAAISHDRVRYKNTWLHLQPDMLLKAVITYNKRSLISWILDPVLSLKGGV